MENSFYHIKTERESRLLINNLKHFALLNLLNTQTLNYAFRFHSRLLMYNEIDFIMSNLYVLGDFVC